MPFEKFSRSYFGSNYEKARRNYESAVEREKSKFQGEYPDANVNDFLFDADLNASGDVIRSFTRYTKVVNFLKLQGISLKKILRTCYIGRLEFGELPVRFNRL